MGLLPFHFQEENNIVIIAKLNNKSCGQISFIHSIDKGLNPSKASLHFLSGFPYPEISEVSQTREIKTPALGSAIQILSYPQTR